MRILLVDIEYKSITENDDYFVSSCGKILKLKDNKITELKPWLNSNGYPTVKIYGKNYPIHRLVAMVWVDGDTSLEVNHKDGNKLNNHSSNLEWISKRENLKHALQNGLHVLKETPIIGINIITGIEIYFSCQADVKQSGFLQPSVNKCLKGHRLSHKGFTWRYA